MHSTACVRKQRNVVTQEMHKSRVITKIPRSDGAAQAHNMFIKILIFPAAFLFLSPVVYGWIMDEPIVDEENEDW